jgi:LacI family transcriptional regulator
MAKTRATRDRERTNAPTLADVARHANVSTATVSRCLNSPERVIRETRDRVMAAVNALGYTPHFGAQALAAKRTNTFGAIIPTMENAIFARGLQAFQEELEAHGITLLAASSSYSPEREEKQIRTLVARGADALLLIGHERTPEIYDFMHQRKIPFVVTWVYDARAPHVSIGFDNRKAMTALVRRVLELGHRTLGFITSEIDGNDRARERYEGVCAAMEAHGLDPSGLQMIKTPYSIENGARAFETLMQGERPTAVLCGNDVLAAGAAMKAGQLGIAIPDDVSITGFDDIEIARIVPPGLTTVHVPHREMGRRCAQALIAMRNGETLDQGVELEAKIEWRGSLGPVPPP